MADLASAIAEMFPGSAPSTPAPAPASAPEASASEPAAVEAAPSESGEASTESTLSAQYAENVPHGEASTKSPQDTSALRVSKSDLALQVARAKRAQQQAVAQKNNITAQQSSDLKRLADLEAIKGDPLKVLEHFGHDYKTTTDRYVKSIESNEEFYVDPVMKEVNSLKEKIAQYEAREQHATDASVVKQFESDASSFISKRSDLEYLAALPDAVDQIRETIVEHWRANKQELSIKEAAEAVEEALTRQAQALSKTQKLRKSLGVFERAPETKKPAEPTSLSGQHVSRSTQTTKPARAKSEEERLADAINEFFGT